MSEKSSVRRWIRTVWAGCLGSCAGGKWRGTSGMVTDDSETFRLGNLQSELVGGSCGAPDRGGVRHNGSNK